MKKILDKLSIEWVLRVSLGLMYVFSGMDMFRNPKSWYWAVKPLGSIVYKIGIDQYLKIQGVGELVLAAILLFSFVPRVLVTIVAGLTVIEMAVILGLIGIDAITFRDIGLLGAALALYLIMIRGEKVVKVEKKAPVLSGTPEQPLIQTYDEFINPHTQ